MTHALVMGSGPVIHPVLSLHRGTRHKSAMPADQQQRRHCLTRPPETRRRQAPVHQCILPSNTKMLAGDNRRCQRPLIRRHGLCCQNASRWSVFIGSLDHWSPRAWCASHGRSGECAGPRQALDRTMQIGVQKRWYRAQTAVFAGFVLDSEQLEDVGFMAALRMEGGEKRRLKSLCPAGRRHPSLWHRHT